jgi:hypothetical protein
MKFLNTKVCADFPKSTQIKRPSFFRDRFEENIERLETTGMIFQSSEQNMAWKKSMNVLSHQVQNCVGTRSGGLWCGNLRERDDLENLEVGGTTILK